MTVYKKSGRTMVISNGVLFQYSIERSCRFSVVMTDTDPA